MARYTKAVCRLCRREAQKLYLKGARCYGPKCAWEKRQSPPGMVVAVGRSRRRPMKQSDYGLQLREKQKCRRIYGVLEKQFRRYMKTAQQQRLVVTGEALMQLLERRLDNVVYRAGLAHSRSAARQLVRHRHIAVNGRTTDIPSYVVRPGDVVEVREKSRAKKPFAEVAEAAGGKGKPGWIEVDMGQFQATVNAVPARTEIDSDVNEGLIVEFYAR